MKTLIMLVLLVSPARAGEYVFTKQVNVAVLQKELATSGIAVINIQTIGNRGVILTPSTESRDPLPIVSAHIFIDPAVKRASSLVDLAELAALETKLDDGTIDPAETRRLIKLVLRLLRISKDGA